MSRNLADLKIICSGLGLSVKQSGKREAKSDYEEVLRQHFWQEEMGDKPLLDQYQPMLARNVKDVKPTEAEEMWEDGGDFVAQEKLDGCRAILQINPKINPFRKGTELRNEVTSRRVSDETYRLNEMTDKLSFYRDFPFPAEWHGAVVDGELIMPCAEVNTGDTITKTVLQATAATLNCSPEKSEAIQIRHGTMKFLVFDLIRGKGGKDLRDLPYRERYAQLQELVTVFTRLCTEKGWSVP